MIGSEIISKTKFQEYLKNVIINKNYLMYLMLFFDQIKDIKIHEKMMFLLYNEYISLEDLFNCARYDIATQNYKYSEAEVNTLLQANQKTWSTLYSYVRDDFFRNYVTTLTFEHYEDINNIKNQLAIVYSSLTDLERAFISSQLGINKDNFIDLVRIQTDNETINLSAIEQNSTRLSYITAQLSGIKDYKQSKISNKFNSEDVSDIIKSVLNKIDLGTIH